MVGDFPSDPLWRRVEDSAVRLVTNSWATVRAGGESLAEARMAKMFVGGRSCPGLCARWRKKEPGYRMLVELQE